MERQQAFKYELMPSSEQQRRMVCYAGCRRVVYNKALALQTANHAAGNKFIRYGVPRKRVVNAQCCT
jgi:putative transposase